MRSNKISKIIKLSCMLGTVFFVSGCSNAQDAYKEMRIANICENHLMSQGLFIKAQSFSDVRQKKSRVVDEYMRKLDMDGEDKARSFAEFAQEYDRSLSEMSRKEVEDFYNDNC